MRKLLILLIFISTSVSCTLVKGNGVDFEIKNNSATTVSNVQIKTTDNSTTPIFKKIESGKSVSGFLKMEKDKNDGSYILEFTKKDGKIERSMTGYYTNGAPIDHKIIFEIEKDTIYFKTKDYY